MQEYLDGLNAEQLESVKTTEGPVRVIAGAGSGKTKALTSRYDYLVDTLGVSTENILCVTFTNKAANEMKKRIRKVLGDRDLALICTFHGFCNYLLRREIHHLNYSRRFIILDNEDSHGLLKRVFNERGISSQDSTLKKAKNEISIAKRFSRKEEYLDLMTSENDSELREKYRSASSQSDAIFYGYLYYSKKAYALDFDDLILLALHLLITFPEVLQKWASRLEYVMVDEFQDVSPNQYSLCSLLSSVHKNLFVVGDPDQTIYSFRGANVQFILDFPKHFPNTKTIVLSKNYRSSPEILNASNSLISHNVNRFEKELEATRSSGALVVYNHAKSEAAEAKWIASMIQEAIDRGAKYGNIAILYRAHFVSRSVEEALIKAKIPYTLHSGIPFYERKEIKDVLSYLRMALYADDVSFSRTVNEPPRGFGKKRMALIEAYSEQNNCSLYKALIDNLADPLIASTSVHLYVELIEKLKKLAETEPPSGLMKLALAESGYEEMLRTQGDEDRLDNIAELLSSVVDYEDEAGEEVFLEDYLALASLYSGADRKSKGDTVSLMTIHASKGLEFPIVFSCGMSEGIFPSRRVHTPREVEEERRLAYVAMTRAENLLYISDSDGWSYGGERRYPSRFIFNIKKEALDYKVELDQSLIDDAFAHITGTRPSDSRTGDLEAVDWKVGNRVKHAVLGTGTIEDIESSGSLAVWFDELDSVRHILPLNAALKKISDGTAKKE